MRELLELLERTVFPIASTSELFNQYADEDPLVDAPGAADIRRHNLIGYLMRLPPRPTVLLVGEAAGPWGCRFSGVPFTGERQLLSCPGFPLQGERSSRDNPPAGMLRRHAAPPYVSTSALVFWDVMLPYYRDPGFIVWDLIPLHPHEANRPLTVRTLTRAEIHRFAGIVAEVVRIVAPETIIAIGRKAEQGLSVASIGSEYVRHPARGGAAEFAAGIRRIPGV
jgi:hypothetical protein